MPSSSFHVRLTADFQNADGSMRYPDIGLTVLDDSSSISHSYMDRHEPEIAPGQLSGANGVIVLTPAVTAASVSQAESLLAVGRFGVGYDAVDVAACTAADVLVFISAGAVDRSVAEATVGWMIALTHRMRSKDQLIREGRWNDRAQFMGRELRERTFGAIGLGGIAREAIRLLGNFGMRPPIAFDPFMTDQQAAAFGVRLVSLDELLATADFVSIHCPLTPQTKGLIGRTQLAKMRPDAYLINTARGGIVDEDSLFDVLKRGGISGAALDCFIGEPLTAPHRFGELENVLLAPHSIAWTYELFRDIGRTVCQGMVDLAHGRGPRGVINPTLFDRPSFQGKWRRLTHRG